MSREESLAPYQSKYPDGFIVNRFLKRPKAKEGLIYTILDENALSIDGAHFIPSWDSTDHLHFVCGRCKGVADVLQVKLDASYAADVRYALFFYLGCRLCGATGQRKVYLDRRGDACKFQHAHDGGNIYIYGESEKPEQAKAG
ncbi:MAG: hypothetical protein QW587_04565 [Candidatus Bathyarchaeia archaeon]